MNIKYSNPQVNNIAQIIPYICAVLFSCFSFVYLYLFQAEFIAQEQFLFSHGQTAYDSLTGALIETCLLTLLGFVFNRLFVFPIRTLALAWFPSCYLLSVFTCVHYSDNDVLTFSYPIVFLLVFPLLFFASIYVIRFFPDISNERNFFANYLQPNLILLSLFFLMIGCMSNTDVKVHHELRMAFLQKKGQYVESLKVGRYDVNVEGKLHTLRVNALLHTNNLPEQLFSIPVYKQYGDMLPTLLDSSFVYSLDKQIFHILHVVPRVSDFNCDIDFFRAVLRHKPNNKAAKDLLLCTYLAKKDLKAFGHTLLELNPDSLSNLPQSYCEAILLYNRSGIKPLIDYKDELTEVNYSDFQHLMDSYHTEKERAYYCREMYGNTYWFYYFFIY